MFEALNRIMIVAVFVLACCDVTMQAQSVTTGPNSDVDFAHSSDAALVSSLKLRHAIASSSLEQQIVSTLASVNLASGLNTSLWICNGCRTSSHPTLGIIVDIDQINNIKEKSQVLELPAILIFLVGHEEAHQVQYKTYSKFIVDRGELERQVYEAQADILGGKYLTELLSPSFLSQNKEAIPEALQVAYDLGVEQYAVADHPSQDARLTAVRFGMAAGTMVKLQQLGGAPALGSSDTIAKKIDFHTNDTALSWSLRTAKRIINYRRPEIVDLVLSDKTINWNKNASTPFVAYQTTYENRGKYSINVNVEVQCVAVPRDNADDFFHWEYMDANRFAFTLAPGAKKTLDGTMQWYASQDLMPRIIASPDPTGLIEVENPTASEDTTVQTGNRGLSATTTAGSRSDVGYWLSQVIGSSRNYFASLRAGPGEKIDADVVYPINPQFPGSLRSLVWLPDPGSDTDPNVHVVISENADRATAQEKYTDIVAATKNELEELGQWKETMNSDMPSSHTFSQGKLDVTVKLRSVANIYRVTIQVTASKGT